MYDLRCTTTVRRLSQRGKIEKITTGQAEAKAGQKGQKQMLTIGFPSVLATLRLRLLCLFSQVTIGAISDQYIPARDKQYQVRRRGSVSISPVH